MRPADAWRIRSNCPYVPAGLTNHSSAPHVAHPALQSRGRVGGLRMFNKLGSRSDNQHGPGTAALLARTDDQFKASRCRVAALESDGDLASRDRQELNRSLRGGPGVRVMGRHLVSARDTGPASRQTPQTNPSCCGDRVLVGSSDTNGVPASSNTSFQARKTLPPGDAGERRHRHGGKTNLN